MKQTDRVPHKARGAAEKRAGVPAQSAGVPVQSAGVPAESAGTTKTSYPLMKYLSLLLAVALLFSGVTFARYLSNDQIDASVGIAAFDATYSVDRVNTTTFGNENYWIETGTSGDDIPQGAGSEITVGITLKNNGDTSVQPTLHLEGPKEYWDHIALQLTTARDVAAEDVLTPQLVIGDIVGASGSDFNTESSEDYGSLGGDATLTLSGNIDAEGGRTATWTYGEGENAKTNKMTITASTRKGVEYAVGFVRQSGDDLLPPIFVDCKKDMTFYSIDLELPALNVTAAQKNTDGSRTAAEQKVVVWLTWTNADPNNSQEADEDFWKAIANGEAPEGVKDESGQAITILGYHFDQSGVPVTDKNGKETGKTTTVRVKKTFASEDGTTEDGTTEDGTTEDGTTEDGTTEGKTEYFHIASLDEEGEDSAYPHAATQVGDSNSTIYQCSNADKITYFDVKNVTKTFTQDDIDMIKWDVAEGADGEQSITYAPVHGRSFGISFRATFVQSSEVPNS